MTSAARVDLAMGMVTAPFAFDRREQARNTMLRYEPVLSGRVVFRFVVGDAIHTKPQRILSADSADGMRRALRRELQTHHDILALDALDGNAVEVACSCVEKTTSWVRYALKAWPTARFIGKTEDDTYVNLAVLDAELRALRGAGNLLYGYMTLAVLPSRPTRHPERFPKYACVTAIQHCRKEARNRRPKYSEGCFLGDLESKLDVPGKLTGIGEPLERWRKTKAQLEREDRDKSPLLQWWRGAAEACGMQGSAAADGRGGGGSGGGGGGSGGGGGAKAVADEQHSPPESTMAPFPTGPLAVFGRDLAHTLFEGCAYLREYEQRARYWGRRTLCQGAQAHLSFASTLCDTVLSHWLARCVGSNVTVAHTTRTKSHHYMWRGAGLGWMAPSNLSLAVHYLKAKPHDRSGPNLTVGGEWNHTHAILSAADASRAAFPPLLYAMGPNYSLAVSHRRKLLVSLNPDVFHWYGQECAFEQDALRKAAATRANVATRTVRGDRPASMSDARYLGGHPPGWPFSGCNPSRFRPYPVWPPPPDVHAAIRAAEEHRPASSSFIYFGHGPSLGELRPRLARLAAALARAGGASAVKPTQFGDMLRLHLRPRTLGSGARQIWQTLRQAEQAGSSAGVREKLLHEMVQARTSLEAFASSVATGGAAGLRAEASTRDQTYSWQWAS